MPLRQLIVILIYLLTPLLNAGVNPFVIENNRYIYKNTILSPIAKEQILSIQANNRGRYQLFANKSLKMLLKPNQKLYIKTQKDSKIYIDYSSDAILSQRVELKKNKDNIYIFENAKENFSALSLYSSEDNNITLLGTFEPNLLENYKADELALNLKKYKVVSFDNLKTKLYYLLPKKKPITLHIDSKSSISIALRAILKGDKKIFGAKQRINIDINGKKQHIEISGKPSLDYISNSKQSLLTYANRYYFNLNKEENSITLYSNRDILISINHYHKNTFYSSSSLKLLWRLNNSLNSINEPLWRNSVIEGGLKRMKQILSQSSKIDDLTQKTNLQKSAKYSVFKAMLYPNKLPKNSYYLYAYHSINHLILNKRLYKKIDINQSISQITKLSFTAFVPVYKNNKKLEYDFHQISDNQSYINLLVWAKDNKEHKFIIELNHQKRVLFIYNPKSNFKAFALNRANEAINNLGKSKSEEIVNILHDKNSFPIINRVGSFSLRLPKGTQSISVYKLDNTPLFIALKEYKSAIYKDTAYNMAHNYAYSYKRFIHSLFEPIPRKFEPWYETTHALRVWILSQLNQTKSQLDKASYSEKNIKSYIKQAKIFNDTLLIRQISKSILVFTKNKNLRRYALKILMKYSLNDRGKLTWLSIYFVKSKTVSSLKALSKALYKSGKIKLALNLLLLADRGKKTKKEIAKLALISNNFALRDEILNLKITSADDILRLKKNILQSYDYQYGVWHTPVLIKSDAGRVKIYSKSIDKSFVYSKASATKSIKLDFNGSYELNFDIRVLNNHSDMEWIDIIHNGTKYLYPLLGLKPSQGLIDKSSNKSISIGNSLRLSFGAGEHHIYIKSHSEQLALSFKAKKIAPLQAQSLNAQLYNPNTLYPQEPTLPYISKLLKDLQSKSAITRLRAKMQGYILKDMPHSIKYNRLLTPLLRYTKFIPVIPDSNPLGYQKFSTSVWQPVSDIQRAREPLLGNLSKYSALHYGFGTLILTFKGKRDIRIDLKEITPKFFPKEPLKVSVTVDNNISKTIELNSKNSFFATKKFTFSSNTQHSVAISLISPLSTQYLALRLFDNKKAIPSNKMQRYFITSKNKPVRLSENAPALLRVIEKDSTGLHRYYKYYSKSKIQNITITPKHDKLSYIRISKMVFDPTMQISDNTNSYIPTISKVLNYDKSTYNIPIKKEPKTISAIQATPTISAEAGLREVDLTSEDSTQNHSQYTTQLALTYRQKIDKYSYTKHRLFTRLYKDPMLGLQNRLYTRVAYIDSVLKLKGDIYTQKSDDKTFANLSVGAKLTKKEPLSANVEQEFSIGASGYLLMGGTPKSIGVDPLVWSRYKAQHRYAIMGGYGLKYRPFDDMRFSYKASLKSNEELYSADNIAQTISWQNHLHPFDWEIEFNNRYYLKDNDRDSGYFKDNISANIAYEHFFGLQRLELKAALKHEIEKSQSSVSFEGVWHWSKQKYRYNFAPDEVLFKNLKNIKDNQSAK